MLLQVCHGDPFVVFTPCIREQSDICHKNSNVQFIYNVYYMDNKDEIFLIPFRFKDAIFWFDICQIWT